MKKDDIIQQKLFETNNLSQFYLEYIINAKWDGESPLLLATAYKQKLNEIVDRYDRMLEANKQREQLCLSFDKQKPPRLNTNFTLSNRKTTLNLPSPLTTRTSTPNKLQTKSTCSSYASSPTTPYQPRSFVRSSSSSSSSTFVLSNNNFSTNQRAYKSPYNQARSYLTISPNKQQSKLHSNSKSELEQRIASIYYDDYDEEENESAYDFEDDKSPYLFNSTKSKLNNNQNKPFYVKDNESNDNDSEYNETCYYETDYPIDDIEGVTTNQIIEKSYSNLSKDSGVLIDSYHSDHSSNGILSGVGCLNTSSMNLNDSINSNKLASINKNLVNDLMSKSKEDCENESSHFQSHQIQEEPTDNYEKLNSIGVSSSSNEDEEVEEGQFTEENKEENKDKFDIDSDTNLIKTQRLNLRKIFNSKLESRRLQNNLNNNSNYGFFNSNLRRFNYNPYRTYNKSYFNSDFNKRTLKKSLNIELNCDLDASSLVSLMMDNCETENKILNLNDEYKRNSLNPSDLNGSNLSLNSNISTPSPSSTTGSSSSSNEANFIGDYEQKFTASNPNFISPNLVSSSSSITNVNNSSPNLLKSTNPLFFNYNSLMNVSMLDSIQVTNNNLDLDNMSSSILMFN